MKTKKHGKVTSKQNKTKKKYLLVKIIMHQMDF